MQPAASVATPEVVPVLVAVVDVVVVDDKLVDDISMECRWSESGEVKNRIVNQVRLQAFL